MEDNLNLKSDTCCNTIQNCDFDKQIIYTSGDGVPEIDIVDATHENFVKLAALLQDSVLHSWKMHLKAKKYSVHIILEEYYNDAFDIIDDLIEHYQGICKCDIICDNIVIDMIKSDDPYIYFTYLKDYLLNFINDSNNFSEKTFEIKSDIDDLLRLIDSTLYKLGHLTESKIKSFEEFVYEN